MIQTHFDGLLQNLFVSHAVSSFKILKQEVGGEEGFIRIKCTLADNSILEFAEYVVARRINVYVETYSYHWQKADGKLIRRWDNVHHYKEIDTFPHHLHLANGRVIKSSHITLKKVLSEIEKTLTIIDKGS